MKGEYDFSKGERGKFFRRRVRLNMPVHREGDHPPAIRDRDPREEAVLGCRDADDTDRNQ